MYEDLLMAESPRAKAVESSLDLPWMSQRQCGSTGRGVAFQEAAKDKSQFCHPGQPLSLPVPLLLHLQNGDGNSSCSAPYKDAKRAWPHEGRAQSSS